MILGIETAGFACSVALLDGQTIVAECHEILQRGHAERLIPMLAGLPDGGRADAIVVGCGPGSFTGVRVGIAAARALGLAWGVPVMGCNSLALVAAEALADAPQGRSVSVVVEGGHGEVFHQRFGANPAPLESLPYAEAARLSDTAWIVGNAAARYGEDQARQQHARAASVRLLAAADRSAPPVPLYGRGPDARPMM